MGGQVYGRTTTDDVRRGRTFPMRAGTEIVPEVTS